MMDAMTVMIMTVAPFLVPVAVLMLLKRFCTPQFAGLSVTAGIFLAGGFGAALTAFSALKMLPESRDIYILAVRTGIIEECAKAMAIDVVLSRYLRYRDIKTGIFVGASVGAGFAALESVLYARKSYLLFGGFQAMLETIIARSLAAPGNHIVWSAIAGAVIVLCEDKRKIYYILYFLLCIVMHVVWNISFHTGSYICLGIAAWLLFIGLLAEEMIKKGGETE